MLRLFDKLEVLLKTILVAVSFLLLIPTLVYVVYFLLVCYDISRVIAGVVTMLLLLYLNKSLTGR